jgi:hypothetical protein
LVPQARSFRLIVLALAAALSVPGCGGNGGDSGSAAIAPSGRLDATYGAAGKTMLNRAAGSPSFIMAVDGAGNAYTSGTALVKISASGAPVQPYNGNVGPWPEISPVTDAAGNVYSVTGSGDTGFMVAKRDATGALVPDFGIGGMAGMGAGTFTNALRLARDAFGNLFVFGLKRPGNISGPRDVLVAKVDANGRRVEDYGTRGDGLVRLDNVYLDPELAVTVDDDGNTFFVGVGAGVALAIQKLDSSGRPATAFGQGAMAQVSCMGAAFKPVIATDRGANVYVGTSCAVGGQLPYQAVVFKVDARGNPVASFGDSAISAGFFAPASSADYVGALPAAGIYALLASTDGSLYVAAAAANAVCNAGMAVVKLGSDGRPVNAFGTNGVVALELRSGIRASLAMDGVGRLYAGGESMAICPDPDVHGSPTYSVYRLSG